MLCVVCGCVVFCLGGGGLLSGPLTTRKSESDSVRRKSETKKPHNSRILKVTRADILWGKSYCPGRGFGAQTGPPGGPQRPKTVKNENYKIQQIRFSECQWAAQISAVSARDHGRRGRDRGRGGGRGRD